ncbi:hypothetical protein [Vreelandella zhanjiangensis]|uniref:hypothetical protein n=1 Tax=Vreelandella zhanjiangensis TaxID=1121960 RepID=UPI00037C26E6|nr:hypothetical protein [Halomonas zhanjiangensis]
MPEHRKIEKIPPTKWDKRNLVKLSELMKEGMNLRHDPDRFSISQGDVSYNGETLKEIIENNDIDEIESVECTIRSWNDRDEIDKGIRMSLRGRISDYQIHSIDGIWFKGKSTQLNEFFKCRQPWYSKLSSGFPAIVGSFQGVLICLLALAAFRHQTYLVLICLIFLIMLGIAFKAYLKGKLFPHTSFEMRPKKKLNIEVFTLFFTAIAALGTVIGICIDFLGGQ